MINNHNFNNNNNIMTAAQIQQMIAENIQLKEDNSKLIKEQREFQDALKVHINALKKLSPWRRFWGYWQLIKDLILTFEEGIKE